MAGAWRSHSESGRKRTCTSGRAKTRGRCNAEQDRPPLRPSKQQSSSSWSTGAMPQPRLTSGAAPHRRHSLTSDRVRNWQPGCPAGHQLVCPLSTLTEHRLHTKHSPEQTKTQSCPCGPRGPGRRRGGARGCPPPPPASRPSSQQEPGRRRWPGLWPDLMLPPFSVPTMGTDTVTHCPGSTSTRLPRGGVGVHSRDNASPVTLLWPPWGCTC